MKFVIVLFIGFICPPLLFSQISEIIPASTSIAQASVADTHSWSSFHNPAMLGYSTASELGMEVDNRFLIPELSTQSFQYGFASRAVNAGVSFSRFGYSLYNEMLAGFCLARNFSDKFSMGVGFNYYTAYYHSTHSYRGTFFPQIGLSVRFSPAFSLGFNTFNPFQTNIDQAYVLKRIPSVYSLGTEYQFSPELAWHTQIDKEISGGYRFATGFGYRMLESLSVNVGGYASQYLVPCLGFGVDAGALTLTLNCELHPLLGLNTMGGVKYRFKK
ncbi:MAG TPA: hypothetical protein VK152_13895 [Paludibacter sp.]|nr:hypothetical protein [Paludibacter sp.]